MRGSVETVSSGGVTCADRRDPLGVVACVVPFNFPFMVPHWTLPLALVTGNTVVLKPSEKVPLTMRRVMELAEEAGFPRGVVNLVNGTRDAVMGLIDHELVRAVTFVGSSPVARVVSDRCRALGKRCTALGGAKNVSCIITVVGFLFFVVIDMALRCAFSLRGLLIFLGEVCVWLSWGRA